MSAQLPAGTIKRLHVDQHVIRANAKSGGSDPPLTIQTSKGSIKASVVDIRGPSRLVYRPDHPLPCGAKCWIETRASVVYV